MWLADFVSLGRLHLLPESVSSSLKWEQIVLKIVFPLSGLNCGKFLKRWEYQTTLPASWEICMQVKKQQLEPDMEQWTGSKLGMEYIKAVYCHPAYLTYMQVTSWETLGWMKHKLGSRLLGELSITSDRQMILPYGRKWRETKEPLDESERGEWKDWLKTQHSEN